MNKLDLIQKIKQLDAISQDERAYLIELLNTKKKYGLVWEDKPENVEEQLRTHLPVLREVVEKRIICHPLSASDNQPKGETLLPQIALDFGTLPPETPNQPEEPAKQSLNHTIIEGDNLHVLTALTFTHEAKIDVIYIDPPYNTGNKDFKYNDSFVDKEDGYRHSKWLSFMDKRLRIAKGLLSEKGVIFISIDDNEQAQLKLLCDEVFGEVNALGPIIQNKQNAKNDSINIQKNHEYIFVYRKTSPLNENNKTLPNLINSVFRKKDVFQENEFYYYVNDAITTRGEGGILNARPNLGHSIYYNPETKDKIAICDYDVELAKTSNELDIVYSSNSELLSKGYFPIRPPKVRGKLGCWTWSLEKINNEKRDLIISGKKDSYAVKKRTFVEDAYVYEEKGKLFFNSYEISNSRSIIDFSTNDGTNVLNDILEESGSFNNPKNLGMIQYFIRLIPNQSATILDFFAGSGTTLHATMALNAEDGGNRQCILVTNNENNICEEVTYQRNKRVIEGYTNAKGVWVAGLSGNNLRYYQSDFVEKGKTEVLKRALTQASTELLCLRENCYQDITLENGFEPNQVRIFKNDHHQIMVLVYHSRQQLQVFKSLIEYIKALDNCPKVKLYAFSSDKDSLAADFEEVADKIESIPLPEALYNAYMATFRVLDLDRPKPNSVINNPSEEE